MRRGEAWALALLLAVGAALRFRRLGALALVGDEAYYWLWSRHLALSYYDHPAGVALLVRLSTALGGQSEAGIRWLNAALGVAAIPLTWLLARRSVSSRAAWLAAALVAVGQPFVLISRHVYPDALLLVLLLAALLLVERLLASEGRPSLALALALGATLAAGMMTKYTAYVYGGVLLAYVLARRPGLRREPRAWLAFGVALLGLLPTIAWNLPRDWASFRWQGAHLAQGALYRASLCSRAANMLDYIGWPTLLLAALGLTCWRGWRVRLLLIVGLALALPVALSPANSPRSLVVALPLLLLPGAEAWFRLAERLIAPQGARWARASGVLLALLALGGGLSAATIYRLDAAPAWLWTGAAERRLAADARGLRSLRGSALDRGELIFCLDYSLAGQFSYYLGQPVTTAWPQYGEWGQPVRDRGLVVSAGYLDPAQTTTALQGVYGWGTAPDRVQVSQRTYDVWHVSELLVPPAAALAQLDFLTLARQQALEAAP
jgi:hypothetical protein